MTDFRGDLPKIDVPVLLVHGDADPILAYPSTAARLPALIKDLTVALAAHGLSGRTDRTPLRGHPRATGWPATRRGTFRGIATHSGNRGLRGLSRFFFSVVGQDAMQLIAGADGELGEEFLQVVFDGAPAHK
jgi:hypothetical protein